MPATLITSLVVLLATSAFAQMGAKPGPEHARLAAVVGTWIIEATEEDLAYRVRETCEWFPGGFHLICRGEGLGDASALRTHGIFGFDARDKTFTRFAHNSFGIGSFMRGSVADRQWTWTGDVAVNGAPAKIRTTITWESPTAYRYQAELSTGGDAWTVVEQGRATKER